MNEEELALTSRIEKLRSQAGTHHETKKSIRNRHVRNMQFKKKSHTMRTKK